MNRLLLFSGLLPAAAMTLGAVLARAENTTTRDHAAQSTTAPRSVTVAPRQAQPERQFGSPGRLFGNPASNGPRFDTRRGGSFPTQGPTQYLRGGPSRNSFESRPQVFDSRPQVFESRPLAFDRRPSGYFGSASPRFSQGAPGSTRLRGEIDSPASPGTFRVRAAPGQPFGYGNRAASTGDPGAPARLLDRAMSNSGPRSSPIQYLRPRRFGVSDSSVGGDGVTQVGRILGTVRPVDPQGRTAVGRALGTPAPDLIGRSVPNFRYRSYPAPAFGYNPFNGRYEPYRGSDFRGIGVLVGTCAPRPSHRFRYRGSYGVFYYPYYAENVIDLGYSVYPSPYSLYGFGFSYLPATRVEVVERPIIINNDSTSADSGGGPVDDSSDYYLNRTVNQGLDQAMSDIRHAWIDGDIDLLLRHVRADDEIHVFLKGKYLYSLAPDDYRDLTRDAMAHSTTDVFHWVGIDASGDSSEAHLRAEHGFTDSDGTHRSVIATFTLVRDRGAWWIAEVGTTTNKDD